MTAVFFLPPQCYGCKSGEIYFLYDTTGGIRNSFFGNENIFKMNLFCIECTLVI
jgi:hypothetical protein